MNTLGSRCLALLAVCLMCGVSQAHSLDSIPSAQRKALVQMAILLDTSNSMDGLIEQAKSQLWKIVNDLQYATQRGERPLLQVALYEYGNDRLSAGEHYIRQLLPFTTDLDLVSEKLFALRTHGGSEYCGAVIQDAVKGLAWDPRGDVYKVLFIAGNEPFTQGPVPFQESIAAAVRKGIVVNPIFCGPNAEGRQTQWAAGALAGRGTYLNIDHNAALVAVPTPYDPEIERLGREINSTYVGYGAAGLASRARQDAMDEASLAYKSAGTVAERALAKAAPQAASPEWDAVAAVAGGRMQVSELKAQELPAEYQGKSSQELEEAFKNQKAKRDQIQKRLAELRGQRETYLAQEAAKSAQKGPMSLDQAMRQAIRSQASQHQFRFSR